MNKSKKPTNRYKKAKDDLVKKVAEARDKEFLRLCQKKGLPDPIQEFMFAKETMKRMWRIDFYFEKDGKKLALEVEGGVWNSGRHNRPAGFVADMIKYNALTMNNIWLLRVTPDMLCDPLTLDMIEIVLDNKID